MYETLFYTISYRKKIVQVHCCEAKDRFEETRLPVEEGELAQSSALLVFDTMRLHENARAVVHRRTQRLTSSRNGCRAIRHRSRARRRGRLR